MSASTINHLRANPKLFKRFKKDPLSTIEELVEITGSEAPRRMTVGEVQLLRNMSQEEFEVLFSLVDRMGNIGLRNFRL